MRIAAFLPALLLAALMTPAGASNGTGDALDAETAGRFAALALDCVDREYPNLVHHVMRGDDDVGPPRDLTPAFYGCFDWHSAVHGHWLLVRLTRRFPEAEFAEQARDKLAANLTEANLLAEAAYMAPPERDGFERPYGLAWLLQLATELDQWDDEQAERWREWLEPVEAIAVRRLMDWIPKLHYPIRIGEHDQTAFAFGLALDYARQVGNDSLASVITDAARDFYTDDRNCPLAYEPSGHDFLSPCLAEADLMRRILAPDEFAAWLDGFLPTIGEAQWLPVAVVTDRSDGKLSHIDGLNLARAWMLEGIAAGLPPGDSRREPLLAAASEHADAGLSGVSDAHYAGGHWLASFAVYLLTERGISP
ncbi:DUF2891 domain-containing protein [Wenzhouxiangella sp. EGI_FJ10409]|uniref:DUF2891 domain-containing protein n=1 Tax=Wenzhouxiangella sp. EGI_FJ10409 TaxID=3243767 RepID=UPI0035E2F289